MITIARSSGIEPIVMTQPALYGGGADPTTGIDFSNRRVNEFASGDQAWRALEVYNSVTRSVAEQEHVLLIDLARSLPKDSRYFTDLVHFSKAGAAEVAEIVSLAVRPTLERMQSMKSQPMAATPQSYRR